MKINFSPTVEGISDDHVIEYYGRIGEAWFVIYRRKDDLEYTNMKVRIGSAELLQNKIKVQRVIRRSNGFTTIVALEDGSFFTFMGLRSCTLEKPMAGRFNTEYLGGADFHILVFGGLFSSHPGK